MRYSSLILGVLLMAGSVGCGAFGPHHVMIDSWTFEQPVTRVEIYLDAAEVWVEGVDCQGAYVELDAEINGDLPEYDVRVDGDTLLIEEQPGVALTSWLSGGFYLQVPRGVEIVQIDVDSGAITVEQIEGDVTATADSGALDFHNIGGDLDAGADSGTITGDGLHGTVVQAETDSGAITLVLDGEPHVVDAHADSGVLDITVPTGTYDITAVTDSGVVDVEGLCHDPAADNSIDARTDSGAIWLLGV